MGVKGRGRTEDRQKGGEDNGKEITGEKQDQKIKGNNGDIKRERRMEKKDK